MATPRKRTAKPKENGKARARKGVKLKPTELTPTELALAEPPAEVAQLAENVKADGGAVLAVYREPLGGHVLLLVALDIEKVAPTPFQRDVSDGHVLKLTRAMDKTRRYLDPIIVVRKEEGGAYETPNGHHRLVAVRELGARSILGLLVPEREVAYQILALNIEKAHNLREKALEVVRMYRDLSTRGPRKETDLALEFEEPALVTLGFAYQKRARLAGSVYLPILHRVDAYLEQPLSVAIEERERRADAVLALDDAVSEAVKRLKDKGFDSPYLKNFVVARINPLRFMKGELPGATTSIGELLTNMTKRASSMDPAKIKSEDIARSGGAPAGDGE
jgi:ParB family chromosome partitioning protein